MTSCLYPWKSIYIHPDGTIRPCCIQKTILGDTKIGDQIETVWNNSEMQTLRQKFKSGRPVAGCEPCNAKEQTIGKSLRSTFNSTLERYQISTDLEDYRVESPLEIVNLDLSFSNRCNLKCRFCGPYNSSSWNSDATELRKLDPDFWKPLLGQNQQAQEQKADFYKNLSEKLTTLRTIELKGGEPFLAREHLAFLQNLIRQGKSSEIELAYTTNGTVILHELKNILPHFKVVAITISVDGTEGMYQYLRGGHFCLEKEIEKTICFFNDFKNVEIIFHFTLSAYNLFAMTSFVSWYKDTRSRYSQVKSWQIGMVVNPKPLQVSKLPLSIRQKALSKAFDDESPGFKSYINALNKETPENECQLWFQSFKKYVTDLDSIRKTSFLEVAPDFIEFWNI